MITAKAEELL